MKYDARKVLYESQTKQFNDAADAWEDRVIRKVYNRFSEYFENMPGVEIYVDGGYEYDSAFSRIIISRSSYQGESGVNWDYDVCIHPTKDTKTLCSWSNGRARTSAGHDVQAVLNELAYSTQLLKEFASLDWKQFLYEELLSMPKKRQFISVSDPDYDPEYQDPGYSDMILYSEVDQIIGKDLWMLTNTDRYSSDYVWVKILSIDNGEYRFYAVGDAENAGVSSLTNIRDEIVTNNLGLGSTTEADFKSHYVPEQPLNIVTTRELIEHYENRIESLTDRFRGHEE